MDDNTFQQELTRLKHRVSQMAATYQDSPVIPQPQGRVDAFHNQLHDLKAQLESMQTSLSSSLSGSPIQAPATQLFQHANIYSPLSLATNTLIQPHSQLSLPSGPLFWQLFTSLRTDVRSLDTRVADAEQHVSDLEDRMQRNLSDLEDRIDRLEPSQLTPAASEDTTLQTSHDFYSQQTSRESHPQQTFQQYDDIFNFDLSTAPAQEPLAAYPHWWTNQAPQSRTDNVAAYIAEHPTYPTHVNFDNTSPAAESVAFRDREIAQLDELMRKAQESIQHYDGVISEKDAQISQLLSERDRLSGENKVLQQTIGVRENTIRNFREVFQEHSERIDLYEDKCQEKSEALYRWASKHEALEQSFLEKKTQLCHASRHVQQLQRALHDMRSSMADEMSQLTGNKDGEIRKLREFCEAREGVVQQQEQIIARGANLLEDRDSELERLSQQIKVLDDDYRNETRERARFARLLDERDEEISQLKSSLEVKQSKHESKQTPPPVDREEKVLCCQPSPFATAVTPGRRSTSNAGQWTPKAIDNYAPLPHEQRRASAWKTGLLTAEQHHKFGVPGELASPTPSEERTPPGNNSRDLRRSDSVKLLQRLALIEEGGSRPARSHTGSHSVMKRSRLPLDNDDDVASRPRLPPRKVISINELGSRAKTDGETGHQRPMSRHQSMQDFPRHKLQAYVEDGAAGGDA